MILVDTSVWVAHLHDGNIDLEKLLNNGHVATHEYIIGELACGTLKNRAKIISYLCALPMATPAEHEEVMYFIENQRLIGKGLGYIDMHLLASAFLTNIPLWTFDKKMSEVASSLEVGYNIRLNPNF